MGSEVFTRGFEGPELAAIAGGWFHPVVAVWLDWPGGAAAAHTGVGTIAWGGYEFLGVGGFSDLQTPGETSGLAKTAAVMRLVGVPEDLDAVLAADLRGLMGGVWFGATTRRGNNVLIGNLRRVFTGYMDGLVEMLEKDESAEAEAGSIIRILTLTLASGPSQLQATSIYHTDESQRALHPDDTAGRLVINAEARARVLAQQP